MTAKEEKHLLAELASSLAESKRLLAQIERERGKWGAPAAPGKV